MLPQQPFSNRKTENTPPQEQDSIEVTPRSYVNEETLQNLLMDEEASTTTPSSGVYTTGTIREKMERNIRELKKQFPMGGVKQSRFITTEILLEAEPNFFSQYDNAVREAVNYSQKKLSDRGQSDLIGKAQAAPTDESLQDDAYRIVQSTINEFTNTTIHRGLDKMIVNILAVNEIIGFGRLDPLWRDRRIDEIMCNGPHDVQIEIDGQVKKVPGCRFRDADHLMALIERLYGAIGKVVSRTTPQVKGRLHDRSRMFVTHPSISPDGPNFNIRRHKSDYIGPEELLKWGTSNEEMLTELGNYIYKGASWLVIGGTSTGKTTLLGALSAFIRPSARVLTLEDNLELKLHPKKLLAAPMETVDARSGSEEQGVSMRKLVWGAMQMRPDGIIIGEVTDGAAYDLCQALNTGHWGASTIHANSEYDAIYRLISLVSQGGLMGGEAALPLISAAFDFMIQVERLDADGSRKIVSISEVSPFPVTDEHGKASLPLTPIWQYTAEGLDENGKVLGNWRKVNEVSPERRARLRLDLEGSLTWEQLLQISKVN